MGQSESLSTTLEKLIDLHCMGDTLRALELVAHRKAEHLRVNWQDHHTARLWDRLANRLDTLASSDLVNLLS